jgi:hypothetical protein
MLYVKTDDEKRVLKYTENLEEAEAFGYDTTVESMDDFESSPAFPGLYLKDYVPEPPYTWKREQEYPKFNEQLDMIWHLIDDGMLGEELKSSDFYLTIKAVKDKYPKEQIADTEITDTEITEIESTEPEIEDAPTDETQEM